MHEYIKKVLGSGTSSSSHNNTALIISNKEIEDIIKIAKSLEDSGLLLKRVTETKKDKKGFLSMLLGTLGASLLGNILTGQGINRAGKVRGINRAGKRIVRVGYGRHSSKNKIDF